MNKYQLYRKANGLCISCGEIAVPGKTRCIGCLQVAAAKQRIKYQERIAADPESFRRERREYVKKWQERNPEKVALYKSRKSQYNRKYFYGEEV